MRIMDGLEHLEIRGGTMRPMDEGGLCQIQHGFEHMVENLSIHQGSFVLTSEYSIQMIRNSMMEIMGGRI